MTTFMRQLPALSKENRDYWTGGQAGELRISQCPDCQRYTHPPSSICPFCMGRGMAPVAVCGQGNVVTFSINHHPWLPGMPVPFVLALVAIAEAPEVWVLTNLIDCAPGDVRIGMPVQVRFEQHEDVWLPMFTPVRPS